jgi:hypothetical protein
MTKLVNIYPSVPVISTNPPIRSIIRNVKKPVEQIRACIMARATVEEILNDGSIIRLDLTNYDKDNQPKTIKAPEPTKVVEIKAAESVKAESKVEIKEPTKEEPVVEEPKQEAVEEESAEIEEMEVLEDTSTDDAAESSEKPVEEQKTEITADELNETIEQIKNKYKNKKRR